MQNDLKNNNNSPGGTETTFVGAFLYSVFFFLAVLGFVHLTVRLIE